MTATALPLAAGRTEAGLSGRAGVSLAKGEIGRRFHRDLMVECSTHGVRALACRPVAELYYRAAVVIGQRPAVRTQAPNARAG